MARSKNVPAPPLDDLPRLPSDDSPAVAETITETISEMSPSIEAPTTIDSLAPGAETLTEASPDLPSLLDRMKAAAEVAKQKVESDWNSLVLKLAIGADVSEAEVIAIVTAASKPLDDLAAAVDRQREVNRLRSVVAEFDEAEREHNRTWVALREFRVRERETIKALQLENKQVRGDHYYADRRLNQVREAAEQLSRMGLQINLIPPSLSASTMNTDKASAVAELDHSVSAVA